MMNTTDEAMQRLYSRQNDVDEELGDGFSKDQHKHLERQHRHTWCIVLSTVVHVLFTQTKYATLKRPLHNHNRHVDAQCEQLSTYSSPRPAALKCPLHNHSRHVDAQCEQLSMYSSLRPNTPLWNALYTTTTDMYTLSVNNCPCTPNSDQTHRSEMPSTQPQHTDITD